MKLRVVEGVVELRPKFQAGTFFRQPEIFVELEIEVDAAWTPYGAFLGVAECCEGGSLESAGVKPVGGSAWVSYRTDDVRSIGGVATQAEVVGAHGYIQGQTCLAESDA